MSHGVCDRFYLQAALTGGDSIGDAAMARYNAMQPVRSSRRATHPDCLLLIASGPIVPVNPIVSQPDASACVFTTASCRRKNAAR
jgi:hypothetical protein